MKITLLDSKQVGAQLERLMTEANDIHWAVAWATETTFSKKLLSHKKKIRQLVIGTDFAQSSPAVLRDFKHVKNTRVMISKSGVTFHPKVYCFVDGKKISAIVGSANFTNGGTSRNEEAAILLEGNIDEKPLQDILDSISSWWDDGKDIDDAFLIAYELRHNANKKHRQAIAKPLKIYRPTAEAIRPSLLFTSWTNYLQDVKNAAGSAFDARLEVLLRARRLLDGVQNFDQLDRLQRRAIAGIIGTTEIIDTNLSGLGWGWFGSMKGAGAFQSRINANDQHLSAALECIPSIGDVTEDDYARYIGEFQLAFVNEKRKGGVPAASRLLAMKRPDHFVCVDRMNAVRLGADVGFAPTTLRLENYWERVVEPITQALWWNTQRPTGVNGGVWDARAAMLDVIYYDGD